MSGVLTVAAVTQGSAPAAAAAAQSGSLGAAAVAQSGPLADRLLLAAAQVVGLSVVAGGIAAVVALLYRWYVRERVPGGLPALFGLSGIVPFLGASQLLRNVITPDGSAAPIDEATALFNITAFLVALGATRVGAAVGDRIGSDLTVATGERAVESEVGRVVQAVGRVITVELPEEVEDIVGYDPVPDETKEKLAGRTFVFPRRLTVDELRERLVTRLKGDYAVGHVDVELADDGSVEYLAVGSRAAGIGPTLPPETSAVAVRADPAFAASAGDLVQVWRKDPFERVLTAEVRGNVDDVVTLAVDAADTRKLDAEANYRLVTLPVEPRPDREFASVLRAADETMAAVTVAAGSALAGQPVGAIDVTVVAVRPETGPVEPLPARDRPLTAGDALYVVATPEAIRKVELGASPRVGGTEPATPSAEPGAELSPDERVDAGRRVAGGDSRTAGASEGDAASSGAEPSDLAGDSDPTDAPRDGEPTGTADSASATPSRSSSDRESPRRDRESPGTDRDPSEADREPSESGRDPSPADSASTADSDPAGGDGARTGDVPSADALSDVDAPEIRALEDDREESTDSPDPDERSGNPAPDERRDSRDPSESTDGAPQEPVDDVVSEGSDDGPDREEPTREDLAELAGTDVDDLTGTDVTVEGAADGEAGGSDAGATDEAETDRDADEADTGSDDADELDTGTDDEDEADGDGADGWTVVVDDRKDAGPDP